MLIRAFDRLAACLATPAGARDLLVWLPLALQYTIAIPVLAVPCIDQVHEGRRYTCRLSRAALIPYVGWLPLLAHEDHRLVVRDVETGEVLESSSPDYCSDAGRDRPFLRTTAAR